MLTPQRAADQRAESTQPLVSSSPLAPIFYPKTVAVIGATEKSASVGRTVMRNLLEQPSGATIFPINPHRPNVLGVRCYANVAAIGEKVDLAIVITPAAIVPDVLRECVEAGVRGAIVISAGFAELGPEGQERERKVKDVVASSHLRLIGPNCLGIMNPRTGLNATFAQASALPGNIAFLSQSGALCTAILDWSRRENVGFSGFVSVGSMLDVSWGDLIYHFADDAYTSSILIYMESIGDARSFSRRNAPSRSRARCLGFGSCDLVGEFQYERSVCKSRLPLFSARGRRGYRQAALELTSMARMFSRCQPHDSFEFPPFV